MKPIIVAQVEPILGTQSKCLHIYDPIYRKNVYVLVDTVGDRVALNKLVSIVGCAPISVEGIQYANASTYCYNHLETQQRVIFVVFSNANCKIGVISHECFHIVEYVMEHIGCKHHPEYSSEPFAYLAEFYTDLIADYLDSVNKIVRQGRRQVCKK